MSTHNNGTSTTTDSRRQQHLVRRKFLPQDEQGSSSYVSKPPPSVSASHIGSVTRPSPMLVCITLLSIIAGMSLGAGIFSLLTASDVTRNKNHSDNDNNTLVLMDLNPTANTQNNSVHANNDAHDNSLVVAYAITITSCGSPQQAGNHSQQSLLLLDAAAVLKHSIHLASSRTTPHSHSSHRQSRYDYQMYAFLHEDVRTECAVMAPALQRMGYRVQWKPTPFRLEDIGHGNATTNTYTSNTKKAKNKALSNLEFFKDKVVKQGCCGDKEFLKLYTLTLTQHVIAVHLDLDSIVLQPLDHLYNAMLDPMDEASRRLVAQHVQSHGASTHIKHAQHELPRTIICYFTRDYNMAAPGIQPTRVLMQGGFWVVRPNLTIYQEIVSLITQPAGQHQFDSTCGWGGCDLGSARLYGGAGFQGVISYYYTYVQGRQIRQSSSSLPGSASQQLMDIANDSTRVKSDATGFVELNRCFYNSMADRARKACFKNDTESKDVAACNHCNQISNFSTIYGAHFTLCQKPWLCGPYHGEQLCYRLHHAWHAIRADFERQQKPHQQNNGDSLGTSDGVNGFWPADVELDDPIPDASTKPRNRYAQRIVQKYPTQCERLGAKGYIPLDHLASMQ